ncbi:TonB-dependent receptor [Capnocytophaga canis]|uniref:TonB-dependent receptor n=1 Tax=Capnocytophaga canis TaxID=1848903 RepID=UPI0037D45F3F
MIKKWTLTIVCLLLGVVAYGQYEVRGEVVDAKTKKPLVGANVIVRGKLVGTATDIKGEFILPVSSKSGELVISYMGYISRRSSYRILTNKRGKVKVALQWDEKGQTLAGVMVSAHYNMFDIAEERKTPTAATTIDRIEIKRRLGNRDFPELLRRVPSTYTVRGGGYGDSSVNIRGFSNENIAVMINGMPVNDMESGRVYWSNWTGLSDVTTAMQVQRGLGASKLAIPSVGGTVNIVMRSAFMKQGGMVNAYVANGGEYKTSVTYNTGKNEKGFSSSFLFGNVGGSKYVDGTQFKGYNYFLALGYNPVEKHEFQLMLTGSPLQHDQSSSLVSIADALKYSTNGKPNRRYNADWGYLDGKEFSIRKNVFHKPVFSLNWDWKATDRAEVNTTAYASFGRGYGTNDYGASRGLKINSFRSLETGLYDFDRIVRNNQEATSPDDVLLRYARVNSHDWFGILTNYKQKIWDTVTLDVGFDGRYYQGYHYGIVENFLGAKSIRDNSNKNIGENNVSTVVNNSSIYNVFKSIDPIENSIIYNNIGRVYWLGVFGQFEYEEDDICMFVQGSISEKGYQRVDNFMKEGTHVPGTTIEMPRTTDYERMLGFNGKAGINKNIDERHNVFVNIGFYSRQPIFDAVYRGDLNYASPDNVNEKVLGIELGYGYKTDFFNAKANFYRTTWTDRFLRRVNLRDVDINQTSYFADISNLSEVHQGIELEASYIVNEYLKVRGMLSVGDWFYNGNADAKTFRTEDSQPYILTNSISDRTSLLLDKSKIGGTAQTTFVLGAEVTPIDRIIVNLDWRYVDRLYSNIDIYAFTDRSLAEKGALRLPSYNLVDFGVSYRLPLFKSHVMNFRFNVDNIFDATYITESSDSVHATEHSQVYKGIDVKNRVHFGFGRTWNFSMRYSF